MLLCYGPLTTTSLSLLQQFLQLRRHGITNLLGGRLTTNITRADTGLDHITHSGLDGLGFGHAAEGVLHHHGDGEDGGDGVHDAFSGDVGGGACIVLVYIICTCIYKTGGRELIAYRE